MRVSLVPRILRSWLHSRCVFFGETRRDDGYDFVFNLLKLGNSGGERSRVICESFLLFFGKSVLFHNLGEKFLKKNSLFTKFNEMRNKCIVYITHVYISIFIKFIIMYSKVVNYHFVIVE